MMNSAWGLMQSMSHGDQARATPLPRGTARRVLGYARPFRGLIAGFLLLVALALTLQSRRDLAAGILPDRLGRPGASTTLSSPFALALRLAAFHLLRNDLKTDPVLVLDDVFAELDAGRRERLAAMVADAEQVLITAAVAEDVPDALSGRTYYVTKGSVSAEEADAAPLTESGTTSGSADATFDDGGARPPPRGGRRGGRRPRAG